MPRTLHAIFLIAPFIFIAVLSKAQNCPPPSLSQEVYIFPYEAQIKLNMSGAASGIAAIVPQGQSFDDATFMAIFNGTVLFQFLTPNTVYQWRARANCNSGGFSDWSPVYTFTTPPPCPPTADLPFETDVTLDFPAPPNPNIGYQTCDIPTNLSGYVFRFITPANGEYRLKFLSGSGGAMQSGIGYSNIGNYCRGGLTCLTPTSQSGTYATIYANAADTLFLAFSAKTGVTANRTIRVEYAPCLLPKSLKVNEITETEARLSWIAGYVDVEITPETEDFSGIPDFEYIQAEVNAVNLTPNTNYRWRVRGNCEVNFSPWVEGQSFKTAIDCDSIPSLKCDSLYPGFKAGVGREKLFKYRPERSYELFLTVTPVATDFNKGLMLALRDTAPGGCHDVPVFSWPVFHQIPADTQTVSLGYVETGKTYYIFADKWGLDSLDAIFQWHCPEACPAPGGQTATDITSNSAKLRWSNNGASEQWELEIRTDTMLFTGAPQHSGTGDSLVIVTLTPFTRYYWRIRQICPGIGASDWSKTASFLSEHDCDNAPELTCNQSLATFNFPGENLLTSCPNWNAGLGAERYYRFTPSYNGQYTLSANAGTYVSYAFKPYTGGCGADSSWTCLGWVTPGSNGSWSLGSLVPGQTYLIAVDFSPYQNYGANPALFQIVCPPPCPAPDSLNNLNIGSNNATLGWAAKINQSAWEIELIVDSLSFSGTPNFFSSQNSLLVQNLWPGTVYKWRVRGVCDTLGSGDWSAPKTFITLPDCEFYPSLTCDQEMILHFNVGPGYWSNLPACTDLLGGQEQILQFTVADANPTRYVYLPENSGSGNYFGFYLKKAGTSSCSDINGWQCIGNSNSTSFITLNNLEQGATYYLLFKKRWTYEADELKVSFHCSVPCQQPQNPDTKIYSASYVVVDWDGGNGPWKYQVALKYENGTEATKSNISWSPAGHDFLSWFTIAPNQVHGWRVRSICENGDTSDWTPYQYFKLPAECFALSALACNESSTIAFSKPEGYHYLDFCSGLTSFGQQNTLRFGVQVQGEYSLRVLSAGQPAIYAFSEITDNQCLYETWIFCDTVTGIDTFTLGNLSSGTYLLSVATADTAVFSHTVELICPCGAATNGSGALFANGSAVLSWGTTINSEDWEIELVQAGEVYSGNPDYTSGQPTLTVNGLDQSLSYEYRVRVLCGAGQSSGWSASFPVTLVTDCTNIPALACGDTLVFNFPNGYGLINYAPCDEASVGKELFFTVTPEYTGLYQMEVVQATGAIKDVHFGILGQCDSPDGAITCIGHGGIGFYWLGYLQAGKTYIMVADNESSFSHTYAIAMNCTPLPNDNPGLFFYPNPFKSYVIFIGDTCQLFTNQGATPTLTEPDMTQPPGTWYDNFEHDVWFVFTAPPGGTVQIHADSDPSAPMDPQIALMTFIQDTLVGAGYKLLATGEDNIGVSPSNAQLVYTGLTPGEQYFVVVDGANNTEGRFCLKILDEPDMWQDNGCQTFQHTGGTFDTPGAWRNLYAGSGAHITGTLLGAIKTEDNLGEIAVSTEILPEAPVLPNGQKILPRYFNIETQFLPQNPVTLRLFFTAEDLNTFNLTPPVTVATPVQLGLTHYDGDNEDCDPVNNVLGGSELAVSPSQAVLVGENGIFYLEAVFDSFSEFGAAIPPTLGTHTINSDEFTLLTYPNPVADELYIAVQSRRTIRLQLRIFNTTAGLVSEQPIDLNSGENFYKIPVEGLIPGVYQIGLFRKEESVGRAIVIKL